MVRQIFRLKENGIGLFINYLDSLRTDTPEQFPDSILTDSQFLEEIGDYDKDLYSIDLSDKFEAARFLNDIVEKINLDNAEKDRGFWTWYSALLFNDLQPRSESGLFVPREIYTMVCFPDKWTRYYRHYLASIWRVWNAHKERPEDARFLLSGPVNVPGELFGQVVSRQERFTRKGLMSAFTKLFWDEETNSRKRGAGGSAGRRIMDVLAQLEVNWDISGMAAEDILELLPPEFDRFLSSR